MNPAKTSDHLVVSSDQDVGLFHVLEEGKTDPCWFQIQAWLLASFVRVWASHPTSLTRFPHLDIRIITVLPHGVKNP